MFRGSCIIDVDNCDTYADGFDCGKCTAGFSVSSGICVAGSGSGTTTGTGTATSDVV